MELLVDGDRQPQAASDRAIASWFSQTHDRSAFIVVRDEALGELRATAPDSGECLVQADLRTSDGPFSGEAVLDVHTAQSLFGHFLKRQIEWRLKLRRTEDPPWVPGLLVCLVLFVVLLLWGWNRGV